MNDALDKEEAQLGFPPLVLVNTDNDVTAILSMTPDQLHKLCSIECGERAFVLRQFATNIQRALNRKQAEAKWAHESMLKTIAPKLAGASGYSFDERVMNASRDNDAAAKFKQIIVQAELRIARLNYLSSKVESQAQSLIELQKSKTRKGDNE